MDELKILIQAQLENNSWKTIQQQLEDLKKKYSESGIELKINIDPKVLDVLSSFNKNINQITQGVQTQNAAIKNSTDNINKETDAIKKATEAQKQWNIEQQKVTKDGSGKPLSVTTTYGNTADNSKQSVTSLPDGSIRKIVDTTNAAKDLADYNKMLDEAYKANDKFDKDAEALDKAHYQALRDNQAKIEAMDKMHYVALQKNRDIDLKSKQQSDKEYEALDRAHYNALRDDQSKFEAMDKMHYMALQKNRDYDLKQQQQADAQEKQHYLALQQNQTREEDYAKKLLDLQTKIQDAQRRFAGDKNLVGNLDNLLGSTQSITSIGNYKKAIGDVDSQLKQFVSTANSAKSNSISFSESLTTALQKFPVWMVATTAFYAPIRAFESAVQTVNDLNKSLTDISIVTGQDQQQVAGLASQYAALGDAMKVPMSELAATAADIYRQGITNSDDVMQRMKDIIEYAKISSLSIQQANEILTATVNSMGVSAQHASDVFSKLGDATATGKNMCPLAS